LKKGARPSRKGSRTGAGSIRAPRRPPAPVVEKFRIDPDFDTPLNPLLEKVIRANAIGIQGMPAIAGYLHDQLD